VAKRGDAFTFSGLGITLPLLLLVLEQLAVESAEKQCWRGRPGGNMRVRKECICWAGSCPLAQPCRRIAWFSTCVAPQVALSLALQIQSNWAVQEQSGSPRS